MNYRKLAKKGIVTVVVSAIFSIVLYVVISAVAIHPVVTAMGLVISFIACYDVVRAIIGYIKAGAASDPLAIAHYFCIYLFAFILCTAVFFKEYTLYISIAHGCALTYAISKYGDAIEAVAKTIRKK